MSTVLVTGGATGLGFSIAQKFAQNNHKVFIASRNAERLKASCEKLKSSTSNPEIHYLQLDLSAIEKIPTFLEKLKSLNSGKVANILINNSAANFISPSERISINAFQKIVTTVFNGTACLTLEHSKEMLKAKQKGCTLSISTPYASTGSAYVMPSACAKAAIESMTKSMGAEWGRKGLKFLAVAPGPIYTEGAFSRLDPTGQFAGMLKQMLPAQRLGTPEELAEFVYYLTTSKTCEFMNGTCIDFDGGEKAVNGSTFNKLSMLTEEQWDLMEKSIRSSNKK